MKNIDFEQLGEELKRKKNTFLGLFILLFFVGLAYIVYEAITIKPDPTVVSDYLSNSKSYNLTFDKNFLKDLYNKKSPAVVVGEGGRNPFAPF